MFLKEVSYDYQGYILFYQKTVKTVIFYMLLQFKKNKMFCLNVF